MCPPRVLQASIRELQGEMRAQSMALQGLPVVQCLCSHGEFMDCFYTQISPRWKNSGKMRAKIDMSMKFVFLFLTYLVVW